MESLVILFLFATGLHNLEEAIWLPKWSKQAFKFQRTVEKNEFRFAVLCITILACLTAFSYIYYSDYTLTKYVFVGFMGAMVLNAIFPHLIATIALKQYAPGLITGLFLNLPINSLIIHQFFLSNDLTVSQLIISTVIVGGILVILIPFLFRIGKVLTKNF